MPFTLQNPVRRRVVNATGSELNKLREQTVLRWLLVASWCNGDQRGPIGQALLGRLMPGTLVTWADSVVLQAWLLPARWNLPRSNVPADSDARATVKKHDGLKGPQQGFPGAARPEHPVTHSLRPDQWITLSRPAHRHGVHFGFGDHPGWQVFHICMRRGYPMTVNQALTYALTLFENELAVERKIGQLL
jgi:hypothetical protein